MPLQKDGPSRSEAQRVSQLRALEKSAQETRMKTTSHAETSARCTFSLQCPTPTEPGPGHRRERGWGLPKPPRRSAVARCNTSAIRTLSCLLETNRGAACEESRTHAHHACVQPRCTSPPTGIDWPVISVSSSTQNRTQRHGRS